MAELRLREPWIALLRDKADGFHGLIEIPERYRKKPAAATVVTDPSGEFKPGERVLINRNAGMDVDVDNEELLLIQPGEVLCMIGADAPRGWPLPLECVEYLEPRPGRILLTRHETQTMVRGIVLPDTKRLHTRRALADVLQSKVEGVDTGDVVLLASGVGKTIRIGAREEAKIESVHADMVIATVVDAQVERHSDHEHVLRGLSGEDIRGPVPDDDLMEFDEGDAYGPV